MAREVKINVKWEITIQTTLPSPKNKKKMCQILFFDDICIDIIESYLLSSTYYVLPSSRLPTQPPTISGSGSDKTSPATRSIELSPNCLAAV